MQTSFARDMLTRTKEGAAALVRAVRPAVTGRDYPTLGALAAGECAAWSGLFTWRRLGSAATVTAPVLLALRPDCSPATRVGLIAAAVGQAAKRGTGSAPAQPSALGVASVSAQYAAFAWQLRESHNDATGWGLRAGAWTAGVALARTRSERLATAIAGVPAAALSALAGDPALRAADATQGLSHGANLLLASEAATVARTRLEQHPVAGRLLAAGQSASQTVGLVLLVDGLARRGRR